MDPRFAPQVFFFFTGLKNLTRGFFFFFKKKKSRSTVKKENNPVETTLTEQKKTCPIHNASQEDKVFLVTVFVNHVVIIRMDGFLIQHLELDLLRR